jgi:hypothetical protein
MTLFESLAHLTPVSVAAFIGSAAMVLTRFFNTSKPLWDKLSAPLQALLPVLVMVLPQLAEKAAGVHSGVDLADLLILAAVMIAPGFHSHTVQLSKPNGPSSGAAVGLVFALGLVLPLMPACAALPPAAWSKLGACADVLEQPLLNEVAAVLAGDGDVESGLLAIVKSGAAKEAIECAVAQLANDIGKQPADARHARIRERGQAFLAAKVPQ